MAYASKEWTEKYLGTTLKAARAEGLLVNGTDFVPVGTIIPFMGVKAPKDYLICDGAVYQISSYSDLASFIERQFGAVNHFGGDGTTTFAVPDLRGEFLRGSGANSHTNQGSGGLVGEHQDATRHLGVASDTNTGGWTLVGAMNSGMSKTTNTDYTYTNDYGRVWSSRAGADTAKTAPSYASRPTNTSVLYCIKATNASDISITNNYLGIERYTEDEICIGESNGKPVYRKIIKDCPVPTTTNGVTKYFSKDISDLNIDKVIDVRLFFVAGTGNKITESVITVGGEDDKYYSISTLYTPGNGHLLIYNNRASWGGLTTDVLIEYTKTTDADDSFTPSMMDSNLSIGGVAYTDYSEEERVIGKWINGKPVYRKVFTFTNTSASYTFSTDLVSSDIDEIYINGNSYGYWTSGSTKQYIAINAYHPTSQYSTGALLEKDTNIDILIRNGSTRVNMTYTVILEYTKTTDAPNSFKPSMVLGGVSIEEASDEDVKEVW